MGCSLYNAVYEHIAGGDTACAVAFGAQKSIGTLKENAVIEMDYQSIVADGYQIITF